MHVEPPVRGEADGVQRIWAGTERDNLAARRTFEATEAELEGERKLVTVLFADVANYTSTAEKLDPEEVHHPQRALHS